MYRRRGFSLTELLIAILILSTLSVLLVGVIPASVIGLKAAGQRANASILARQLLEEMQRDGFDALGAAGSSRVLPVQTVNGTEYRLTVRFEEARDSSGSPMEPDLSRLVEVEVKWRSHVGNHDADTQKEFRARVTFYKQI